MKNLIRIFTVILVISTLLSITGCGSEDYPEKESEKSKNTTASTSKLSDAASPDGYWQLESSVHSASLENTDNYTVQVEQFRHTRTYHVESEFEGFGAFSGKYVCSCTELSEKYYPGDTIKLTITGEVLECSDQSVTRGLGCQSQLIVNDVMDINDQPLVFVSENGYASGQNTVVAGKSPLVTDQFMKKMSDTLTCTLPSGEFNTEDYKTITIGFYSDVGESVWKYNWIGEN